MSDAEWTLRDTERERTQSFESRSDAESARDDMIALGRDADEFEVVSPGGDGAGSADAETDEREPVPEPDGGAAVVEPHADELPEQTEVSVQDDPVEWLPGHFVDDIQGVPTVNRKGYAVISSKYGISVEAEPVTLPSETGFEYAEFRATAETPDGETYSGFGSAHVSRQDGDDQYLLAELAETRAMKRAVAWASGVGLTAMSELKGGL